jgi:hypothetical protein
MAVTEAELQREAETLRPFATNTVYRAGGSNERPEGR